MDFKKLLSITKYFQFMYVKSNNREQIEESHKLYTIHSFFIQQAEKNDESIVILVYTFLTKNK